MRHVTRAADTPSPHLDLDRDGRGGGRRVAGLLDLVVVHFQIGQESDTNQVSDRTAAGRLEYCDNEHFIGKMIIQEPRSVVIQDLHITAVSQRNRYSEFRPEHLLKIIYIIYNLCFITTR